MAARTGASGQAEGLTRATKWYWYKVIGVGGQDQELELQVLEEVDRGDHHYEDKVAVKGDQNHGNRSAKPWRAQVLG